MQGAGSGGGAGRAVTSPVQCGAVAYLVVTIDGKTVIRQALAEGKAVVLGRQLGVGLWLDDARLSRQHCRFEQTADDAWAVIDLGSTNGTTIAGERISFHRLPDGDEIEVGRSRVTFHAGEMPPPRPTDPVEAMERARIERPQSPHDTLVDSRWASTAIARPLLDPKFPHPQPKAVAPARRAAPNTLEAHVNDVPPPSSSSSPSHAPAHRPRPAPAAAVRAEHLHDDGPGWLRSLQKLWRRRSGAVKRSASATDRENE